MKTRKLVFVVLGAVLVLVGALWTGQGLGYIGGSAMTGSATWAIVGPIVAGFGVAMVYVAVRSTPNDRSR